MQTVPETPISNRIGFHYFPDTAHYTSTDLDTWLPLLAEHGASWLVITGDASRAIPESFITALTAQGIEPIIHLPLALPDAPSAADLRVLLRAYASWGVKYVILFDRPNSRAGWTSSGWSQANLVESFLDCFLPVANECLNSGLTVVFPPLDPGGNYWDVSFLRNSLLSMQRRGQKNLLDHLVLSSYTYTYGHPLDWGRGGSERWSGNKPYSTPDDSQDQIGFNNSEWLQETARLACGRNYPVILLGAGLDHAGTPATTAEQQEIVEHISKLSDPSVLAAAFPLVGSDGALSPIAALLKTTAPRAATPAPAEEPKAAETTPTDPAPAFPIKHYLLLPAYEWGVSDWHLDVIKPFVRKHQPTVGFSIEEAALAAQVTVIGGAADFSDDTLTSLRSRGCRVERISGDGTTIATQLSER
jgi:hypothetical protein